MKKNFLLLAALPLSLVLQAQPASVDWDVIATRAELPDDPGTQPVAGHFIWGDYNNDGYKDAFLIAGEYDETVQLWKNNGDNTFSREQADVFQALRRASAVFIDYDNDGDLDLITTGNAGSNKILVYKNTGSENGYAFEIDADRTSELNDRANVNLGDGNSVGRILNAVDYNNDGWMDLIIAGNTNYNTYGWNPIGGEDGNGGWGWLDGITLIAKNNKGSFETTSNVVREGDQMKDLIYFRKGSIHVGDVNGDGYSDILVQGWNDYGLWWSARLYINNQDGTFSVSPYSSQLNSNEVYETIFADINSDGFDDLVEISKAVANVHISDGQGGFTKIDINTNGLIRVVGASITAGDINNDGWIDLLVSGMDGEDNAEHAGPRELGETKIFYNNGDSTFTAANVLDNMRARTGSVALVDVNNDGNLDFSNLGWGRTVVALNKLGEGISANTAPTAPTGLTATYADGKYSLNWSASSDAQTPTAAIRYNVYAKNKESGSIYVYAPVDIATGRLKIGGQIVPLIHGTSFEWNLPEADYEFGVQAIDQADAASAFTTIFPEWDVIATRADGIGDGAQAVGGRLIWGDFNNDGNKDAFVIGGLFGQDDCVAQLWKNNGDNTFERVQSETFQKMQLASAVFIDYDNDGDLDLITTGKTDSNKIFVYKNTGSENGYAFEKDEERTSELDNRANVNIGNDNSVGRILNVVDYDNDGWLDLIVAGHTNWNVWGWNPTAGDGGSGAWDWMSWSTTAVIRNNQGSFKDQVITNIVEDGGNGTIMTYYREGSIHVGDVNGDGYSDVLVQGYNDYGLGFGAKLYINNQNGKFTLSPYSSQLHGNQSYETIFADINSDGFDDLVEISKAVANIHVSDGLGGFTKHDITTNGLIRTTGASITAGDINNDGWIDLLVSGLDGDGENDHAGPRELGTTKIFYNNGDLTFTAVDVPEAMRARTGSVSLVDINNDGNLDFSNFGWGNGPTVAIAINKLGYGIESNTAPAVPANFAANYADGKYSLSWSASSDAQTPTAAIRYNVYAKNIQTNAVYAYAPVNIVTGRLKIGGEIVPLIHGTSFEWNLPEADYEFGVQAIDQADLNSAFVTTTTETIGTSLENPTDVAGNIYVTDQTLYANGYPTTASISIYDTLGRTVVSNASIAEGITLPSGYYVVNIQVDGKIYSSKVLVK